MSTQNKVLILSVDTLIGLGLKTLLIEHLGLQPSFLSSWNELPDAAFRIKQFQIIFCDEKNSKEVPQHLARVLQKKIVLIQSKKNEEASGYRFLDITQPMEKLLSSISIFLNVRHANDEKNNSHLTSREIEVLKLLACGYINKEIANKLSISSHTVISHRKNISTKLGIKTVSGLTVYATINKLISPDSIL